ncbi:MAG TPA: hypothetical protein VE130_03645 [Nitrososphaeraceae archaeon]|nr:hypothetical protein [Nitrososphaeraceae archaeon]
MKSTRTAAAIAITTVLVVSMTLSLMYTNNDVLATKYKKSQAASQANGCGNGDFPFNVFCQNILSQLEGDGNAINIIALQPSSDHLNLLP